MKKVLLIDDERTLNETLTDVIEALGHEVSNYLSIKEALQEEDFSSVDMVICDIGLPGECAFSFVQWIKLHHDHIPFVILSAFAEEEMIQKGMDAGADQYLVKPPKLSELRQVLTFN